jgi:uncharacterized protein YbcI
VARDSGSTPGERLAGGQLTAAISNAAVRIHRDFLGRGPDTARTMITDDTVVVLMQDTLTKAERSLVAAGKGEMVLRVRQTFQETIGSELVAAIEELTGRPALAYMSANHIDPDIACEIILLAPAPTASARPDQPHLA